MTNKHLGMQHYMKRNMRNSDKKPDNTKRILDNIIYIAVFLAPIMNIPQLIQIYRTKLASGVSYISWFSFTLLSLTWLFYGIVHKEKPIIYMNLLLMIIQLFIAIGALIYS